MDPIFLTYIHWPSALPDHKGNTGHCHVSNVLNAPHPRPTPQFQAPLDDIGTNAGAEVDGGAAGSTAALAFGVAAGAVDDSFHCPVAMAAIPLVACASASLLKFSHCFLSTAVSLVPGPTGL